MASKWQWFAPGTRKGNKTWLVRGREFVNGYKDKQRFEIVSSFVDKKDAEREFPEKLETWRKAKFLALKFLTSGPQKPQHLRDFKTAADLYIDARPGDRPVPPGDRAMINRLVSAIGNRLCADLVRQDLTDACIKLYPGQKASSWNRSVMAPASAILRYVGDDLKWFSPMKIARFEEDEPETKALRPKQVEQVLTAALEMDEGFYHFLVFLFAQGLRVSDALKLAWERVNLEEKSFTIRIGKKRKWKVKFLHQKGFQILAKMAEKAPALEGRVFPYASRNSVWTILARLEKRSGIHFTAHMARHTFGFSLGKEGYKSRMALMDHSDPRSTMRYDMSEEAEQRAALKAVLKEKV